MQKKTYGIALAVMIAVILVAAQIRVIDGASTGPYLTISGPYKVLRVVDGDTIEIDRAGKKVKIRMLCINTPESVHPDRSKNTEAGKLASEFTKERLTGRWVLLEFEGKEKEDRYGRLLAYIHVNYNVELVYYGHSEYYTKYGKSDRYDAIFREAER